jgi:hypothetical protein
MTKPARTQTPDLKTPETIRYQNAVRKFLDRVDAYGKRENLTSAQVSKRVFGHTDRLDDLRGGASYLAPDTYEKMLLKLAELEKDEKGRAKRGPKKREPTGVAA